MLSDEITISKGTCYAVAASIVLANFLILFAAITWMSKDRQAELNAVHLHEMRQDVNAVSNKMDELQRILGNQAVRDAEIKGRDFGYRVGKTDGAKGH